MDRVKKRVTLVQIPDEEAQAAWDDVFEICERNGVGEEDRDHLWKAFACICTHLLLKNGELPGPDDPSGSNGHALPQGS